MANIIIRGRTKIGKTHSEQEKNLRKEWGMTMTDKQLDRMEYVEKIAKKRTGSTKNFIQVVNLDRLDK